MARYSLLLGLALLTVAGCSGQHEAPRSTASVAAGSGELKSPFLGRWNGPEGTFLDVKAEGGNYMITVQNLDGPRTFKGMASGDAINFERDGKTHVIRATDGVGTGMKWLANRKNCVVVEIGEGYCRD